MLTLFHIAVNTALLGGDEARQTLVSSGKRSRSKQEQVGHIGGLAIVLAKCLLHFPHI